MNPTKLERAKVLERSPDGVMPRFSCSALADGIIRTDVPVLWYYWWVSDGKPEGYPVKTNGLSYCDPEGLGVGCTVEEATKNHLCIECIEILGHYWHAYKLGDTYVAFNECTLTYRMLKGKAQQNGYEFKLDPTNRYYIDLWGDPIIPKRRRSKVDKAFDELKAKYPTMAKSPEWKNLMKLTGR